MIPHHRPTRALLAVNLCLRTTRMLTNCLAHIVRSSTYNELRFEGFLHLRDSRPQPSWTTMALGFPQVAQEGLQYRTKGTRQRQLRSFFVLFGLVCVYGQPILLSLNVSRVTVLSE